jgi:hypothetical protein
MVHKADWLPVPEGPMTDTGSVIDAHVHLWDLAVRDQP